MTTDSNRIAREGIPFIIIGLLLSFGLAFVHPALATLGLAITLFIVYFFRNPVRVTPDATGKLICPADGKIIVIDRSVEPDLTKKEWQKISIFMSPFNVHVNRAPASGTVEAFEHKSGKFWAAFDKRASHENERACAQIRTTEGDTVVFVQVAGWFARRIVSYLQVGQQTVVGRVFGLIRFGSRMDIYFPDSYQPQVKIGDLVTAGETVLAKK